MSAGETGGRDAPRPEVVGSQVPAVRVPERCPARLQVGEAGERSRVQGDGSRTRVERPVLEGDSGVLVGEVVEAAQDQRGDERRPPRVRGPREDDAPPASGDGSGVDQHVALGGGGELVQVPQDHRHCGLGAQVVSHGPVAVGERQSISPHGRAEPQDVVGRTLGPGGARQQVAELARDRPGRDVQADGDPQEVVRVAQHYEREGEPLGACRMSASVWSIRRGGAISRLKHRASRRSPARSWRHAPPSVEKLTTEAASC
jgi:hypothetical protein